MSKRPGLGTCEIARNRAIFWVSQQSKWEIGLGGGGARIRTWEWRNQNPSGSRLFIKAYSEKSRKFDLHPIKRLAGISE
jgi:hypothetical protein